MDDDEGAWGVRPLIPGAWRTASLADACALVARFTAYEARRDTDPLTAETASFRRARLRTLQSLPGWLLVELEALLGDGDLGHMAFLMGPGGLLQPVDWSSAPVHLAAQHALVPNPDDLQAAEFLHLFCNLLRSAEGRFHIACTPDDVDLAALPEPAVFAAFRDALRPLALERTGNEIFADATMVYAGQLARVRLRLTPDGRVDMVDDNPLCAAPVQPEDIRGLFRVVGPRTPAP